MKIITSNRYPNLDHYESFEFQSLKCYVVPCNSYVFIENLNVVIDASRGWEDDPKMHEGKHHWNSEL